MTDARPLALPDLEATRGADERGTSDGAKNDWCGTRRREWTHVADDRPNDHRASLWRGSAKSRPE